MARLKVTALVLGLVLIASSAVGEDTLAEIKRRGAINIFMEAQYRPYEFRDQSGEIVGLDVDLAKKMFAEGLGVKVNVTDLDFSGLLATLLTRKSDLIISGITITKERATRFDFSIPYSEAGTAILVRPDDTRMSGADDLSGKMIGTQIGSASHRAAEAFDADLKARGKPGYAELKTYERFPIAYQDLLARRLDAVVQGRPPLKVLIKERPNQFKILAGLGPRSYYGVLIRKGDAALLEYVNAQIRKYKGDGTLKALQEKWFGESDVDRLPDPWTPLS
jgi:polar amino acid transport system substrate-binding protein